MTGITIFHLEMLDRNAFHPKPEPPGFELVYIDTPNPELNRNFYQQVGGSWNWSGRLKWSDEDWLQHVEKAQVHTFVGQMDGQPIGYVELEAQSQKSVEILYFGLLPAFIGKGLGGSFLSACVRQAWALPGTRRVWLHTCTEDHPNARANYEKRGFKLFKTEVEE